MPLQLIYISWISCYSFEWRGLNKQTAKAVAKKTHRESNGHDNACAKIHQPDLYQRSD